MIKIAVLRDKVPFVVGRKGKLSESGEYTIVKSLVEETISFLKELDDIVIFDCNDLRRFNEWSGKERTVVINILMLHSMGLNDNEIINKLYP